MWFEWTRGNRAALSVLRRHLGWGGLLRLLPRFLWRQLTTDPFASLPKGKPLSRRERLTRRQLRPVLILDDLLATWPGLEAGQPLSILEEVVSRSGAQFLAWSLPVMQPATWRAMSAGQRRGLVEGLLDRFFNMEAGVVEDAAADLAFDVSGCLFASLTTELGRPHLAPLFCAADSVYFEDPSVPVALRREDTIARGGDCCSFRLSFKPGAEA
jgi:hypothetical protein